MIDYSIYEIPSNYKFIYNQTFPYIAASAIFLTKDNYYILGKIDNSPSSTGKVKFLESILSRDSLLEDESHPITSLKKESLDKLGIDLDAPYKIITITPYCFITEKNLSFINLCFEIKLNLSIFEVVTLFNSHTEILYNQNLKQDLSSIVFVENKVKSINDFIDNNKNVLMDYTKNLFEILNHIRKPKSFLIN